MLFLWLPIVPVLRFRIAATSFVVFPNPIKSRTCFSRWVSELRRIPQALFSERYRRLLKSLLWQAEVVGFTPSLTTGFTAEDFGLLNA
jgi:hypothetical protein